MVGWVVFGLRFLDPQFPHGRSKGVGWLVVNKVEFSHKESDVHVRGILCSAEQRVIYIRTFLRPFCFFFGLWFPHFTAATIWKVRLFCPDCPRDVREPLMFLCHNAGSPRGYVLIDWSDRRKPSVHFPPGVPFVVRGLPNAHFTASQRYSKGCKLSRVLFLENLHWHQQYRYIWIRIQDEVEHIAQHCFVLADDQYIR